MTSHSDGDATDDTRATVAGTVATAGDGVGGGAVAAADDTVIDSTVADTGTVKKQNFHTGLDPVSRTNNSAQPSEFDAVVTTVDTVRFAQSSSLDTGSSPVWSVVAGTDASDNDRAAVAGTVATVDNIGDGAVATVTVTNPDDATIVTNAITHKSSFPRTREKIAGSDFSRKPEGRVSGRYAQSRTNNSAQPTEFNAVVAGDGLVSPSGRGG